MIAGEIIRYDTSTPNLKGSGGNYLSNEIMYRTTKLRDTLGLGKKYVGHFHLGLQPDINLIPSTIQVVESIITKIYD